MSCDNRNPEFQHLPKTNWIAQIRTIGWQGKLAARVSQQRQLELCHSFPERAITRQPGINHLDTRQQFQEDCACLNASLEQLDRIFSSWMN
jgi:hypothetical protein